MVFTGYGQTTLFATHLCVEGDSGWPRTQLQTIDDGSLIFSKKESFEYEDNYIHDLHSRSTRMADRMVTHSNFSNVGFAHRVVVEVKPTGKKAFTLTLRSG